MTVSDAGSAQSGWATMPTRHPSASSTRPTTAAPKDGWSR
jgi:uracil-DNA glycosylase